MVRAVLEGRKTQTRRLFKVRGPMGNLCQIDSPDEEIIRMDDGSFHYLSTSEMSGPYPCPYGAPGERLWVRETFAIGGAKGDPPAYRADMSADDLAEEREVRRLAPGLSKEYRNARWRPSIHMPRWASRITLEVTGVRVERLHEISYEDACAEGCAIPSLEVPAIETATLPAASAESWDETSRRLRWPQRCYEQLWDSINGAESWAANPWVWVIEFKRVTQ